MILIHELHVSQVVTFLLIAIVGIAVWVVNDKRFIRRTNQITQVYYKAKGQFICE